MVDLTDPSVVCDVLTRSIERMRHSWGKGSLVPGWDIRRSVKDVDPDGCPVCAVGALSWALCGHPFPTYGAGDDTDTWDAIDVICNVIYEANGGRRLGWRSLSMFNDDPLTIEEDVVDVLRTAIQYVKDLGRLPIDNRPEWV